MKIYQDIYMPQLYLALNTINGNMPCDFFFKVVLTK